MTYPQASDTARDGAGAAPFAGETSPGPDATQELTVSDIVEVAAALGATQTASMPPPLPPRASSPSPDGDAPRGS